MSPPLKASGYITHSPLFNQKLWSSSYFVYVQEKIQTTSVLPGRNGKYARELNVITKNKSQAWNSGDTEIHWVYADFASSPWTLPTVTLNQKEPVQD